jgi:hypothetical protein
MVVWEKMHTSKSWPKKMKSRSATSCEESPRSPSEADIIDPTDTLDLLPPSPAYPFAVPALVLHEGHAGLSFGGSLAAAEPRPSWVDWRKALLYAAEPSPE